MKTILISLIFLFHAFDLSATSFLPSWIGSPRGEKGAQVWFRKDFFFDQRPRSGYITIVTTGYVEVFVNGRNVSTDVLMPTRSEQENAAVAVVYDVTRFLRARDNVVAVWFSPLNDGSDAHQVALSLYGKERDGRSYSYSSDGEWLCRQAPMWTDENGREYIDGRENAFCWLGEDFSLALWTNVVEAENDANALSDTAFGIAKEQRVAYKATRFAHTLHPKFFDVVGDSVVYDFGSGAQGMLRVTFRGTKRGEKICFGNILYTCSGESDEQIIQRFSLTDARRILVFGDENFTREQVNNVELTTTEEYFRLSYK